MRELFRELAIGREQVMDAYDERMTLAWSIAALNNSRKLPKLATLLSRQRRQTPADQRAVLQSIAGHLGRKLLKRKREREH